MGLQKHYLFTLKEDRVVQTNIKGKSYVGEWGVLDMEGRLTVHEGYSWDGATPRFILSFPKLNFWTTFGTWNGPLDKNGLPLLYDCTLAHDFGNQFLRDDITYKEWHHLMTDCMKEKKFKFRRLYAFVIYTLGWIWWNKK